MPDRLDALELNVTFQCTSGQIEQAAVSVNIDCSQWSADNYVLMPSVAYNGNKFEFRRLRYSPKLYEIQDIGPDKPIIVTDILRLDKGNGFLVFKTVAELLQLLLSVISLHPQGKVLFC
ncbi:hypothetical protein SFC43_25265 [Bacteroides sp. CR5/BHMF/2]|nr:hypothetical protein [Bacteroides sp. CR5/BHMF/2]